MLAALDKSRTQNSALMRVRHTRMVYRRSKLLNLWFTYEEAREMVLDGKMQEGRIALALLRYLHKKDEHVRRDH